MTSRVQRAEVIFASPEAPAARDGCASQLALPIEHCLAMRQ
jgi:hypothetical protein